MTCSSCGGRTRQIEMKSTVVNADNDHTSTTVRYTAQAAAPVSAVVVPRSTTKEKVKLRYYGGGMTKKVSSGCSSCRGGKGSYSVTTTETIMFVSEDAPNGIFKEVFTVGHNYYVTRAQADYLLTLTYRDVAGNQQPKFKEIA